ncbi:MAG: LacI family DNA-binding transcriptional regulator [Opitutales bacterium]|nr:LacI family DNA-binding transcriptional regulator [Opitutales bacterium]
MTVSFALRNNPRVARATRERVQNAAKELGYHMDPEVSRYMRHIASGNAGRIQDSLGFLHLSDKNDREVQIHEIAEARARELGYSLYTLWASDFRKHIGRVGKIFQARGISAFIVGNARETLEMPSFNWNDFSVVEIGHTIRNPPVNRVIGNHFDNTVLALERIIASGYRRIGFVSPKNVSQIHFNRPHAAYLLKTQSTPGITGLAPLIAEKQLTFSSFKTWFSDEKPDAIFTTSHLPCEFLRKMDIRIPDEVGLVEYHDAASTSSEVTAVIEDRALKVQTGIDLLVSMKQKFELGLPRVPIQTLVNGIWNPGITLLQKKGSRNSAPKE